MSLLDLCIRSLYSGLFVNLDECYYDNKRKIIAKYYNFLYGFIRESNAKRIIEIGTFQGGSSQAMSLALGMRETKISNCLVTIDIKDQMEKKLKDINYIIGDSLDDKIVEQVGNYFNPTIIDVLFVDSVHNYNHVMNTLHLYGGAFHPKYVILDDIFLNDSMKQLWNGLSKRYLKNINVSDMVERSCGFGVIQCR